MKPVCQLLTICLAVLVACSCLTRDAAAESQEQKKAEAVAQAKADADRKAAQDAKDAATRAEAIQKFTRQLSGSTLVGKFTLDDAPEGAAPKPDRYQIATVSHTTGDNYVFIYVHKGVPIPLTLKVLWAGNTPVITLDDFTIAGMGTFSARVMFHGDRYAGTWQHGKKGGLMYGKIEKPKKPGEEKKAAE